MIQYPRWLRQTIRSWGIIHDLAIMAAAWFAYNESPVTIVYALGDLRYWWAGMLLIGGTIALIGSLANNLRAQITGCVTEALAKLVWVAAAAQPAQDVFGTETLICILVAGAAGTMWRVLALLVGYYLNLRRV